MKLLILFCNSVSPDKSTKCGFINTAPREERTFLLKAKKYLTELPEESTNIEADYVIKRYASRPEALETYCLADYVSKVVSEVKLSEHSTRVCEGSNSETDMDLNKENAQSSNHDEAKPSVLDPKRWVQDNALFKTQGS